MSDPGVPPIAATHPAAGKDPGATTRVWASYCWVRPCTPLKMAAARNSHPIAFEGRRQARTPPLDTIAKLGCTASTKAVLRSALPNADKMVHPWTMVAPRYTL